MIKRSRKLAIIRQAETAECGICCLAMVANFYGQQRCINSLRDYLDPPQRGTSLKLLMKFSEKIGFSCKAFAIESADALKEVCFPCIAHWKGDHYVVIKSAGEQSVTIHDPAEGVINLSTASFSNLFSGVVLTLTPTLSRLDRPRDKTLRLRDLIEWDRYTAKVSLYLIGATIGLQALASLAPLFSQIVIDDVIVNHNLTILNQVALAFFAILVLEVSFRGLRELNVVLLYKSINKRIADTVFSSILQKSLAYFQRRSSGDIMSRLDSIGAIRNTIANDLISSMVDFILILIVSSVMLYYSAALSLMVFTFSLIYLSVRLFFYKKIKTIMENNMVLRGEENTYIIETLNSIKSIKIFNFQDQRCDQILIKNSQVVESEATHMTWNVAFSIIQTTLFGLASILIMYHGATAISDGAMSAGMLIAFLAYANKFMVSFDWLVVKLLEVKTIQIHVDRISDIVSKPSNRDGKKLSIIDNDTTQRVNDKDIDVKNISYSYSSHEAPVFSNVSFTIPHGKITVITGPSGCGKTTLVNCLMGITNVSNGSIEIGGRDICEHPIYKTRIAAITQGEPLFTGTLAENISFFDPNPDTDKITKCAKLACIHETIMNMPMSYRTVINGLGSSLSGGQTQRVLLARALYKDPDIIFLDEATSNLDLDTERDINNNLRDIGITRIIVAHRNESLALADNLISM